MAQWLGCIDEPVAGDSNSTANYTYITPITASEAGYVTIIEIWIGDDSGGVLDFAVFNNSGGSTYADEHRVTDLSISNGLNQFYAGVDFAADALPIDIGQYLGVYVTSSGIFRKITSGGSGYLYDSGDQIGSGGGTSFTASGNITHELQFRVWIE